tara:strand:- start:219 stop:659 length:441 start_codon:yes stop_codon:yes gene_type:complete
MKELPYEIIDKIVDINIDNGILYNNIVSTCSELHAYGKYRTQNMRNIWCVIDAISNDNIEEICFFINKNPEKIDECIKQSILNGFLKISWWLWQEYRPVIRLQLLLDIEQKMVENSDFTCGELTYRILSFIHCAHLAAHKINSLHS